MRCLRFGTQLAYGVPFLYIQGAPPLFRRPPFSLMRVSRCSLTHRCMHQRGSAEFSSGWLRCRAHVGHQSHDANRASKPWQTFKGVQQVARVSNEPRVSQASFQYVKVSLRGPLTLGNALGARFRWVFGGGVLNVSWLPQADLGEGLGAVLGGVPGGS